MITNIMETIFNEYLKFVFNYSLPDFYVFEEHPERYVFREDLCETDRRNEIAFLEKNKLRLIQHLDSVETKKHRYKLLFHIGIIENNIYKHKQYLNV